MEYILKGKHVSKVHGIAGEIKTKFSCVLLCNKLTGIMEFSLNVSLNSLNSEFSDNKK